MSEGAWGGKGAGCGMLAGMNTHTWIQGRTLPLVVALLILTPIYLTTLQSIPNGAEHYYMIDVGETQIVLNRWGTLHATGYPLYVMVGNVLVALLRGLGVSAATAPGVTSLLYGLVALGLIYGLALVVMGERQRWLAAGMVVVYGLTRTVWIHNAIAEIYSFGLVLLAGLLLLALWPRPVRGRVYWLALIGGIGVFHHRALLMVAPALLYAVWGEVVGDARGGGREAYGRLARRVLVCLALGLAGFAQYLYLPLRAMSGAAWVYGEPQTWDGFWDQFLGREASRFIGAPATFEGLLANLNLINTVLVTDLTAAGIGVGLVGLAVGLATPARRRATITLVLSGGAAYGFHVLLYTDVLSALVLPVTLTLAFGWLLLAEWAVERVRQMGGWRWAGWVGAGVVGGLMSVTLVGQNWPFIHELTTNPTGGETITLAKGAPAGSTLMLDWGPRHFAVGFARDVLGELPDVRLVSHKADLRTAAAAGELVTLDFTFYNRPIEWWEAQLGERVYLWAAAPRLVVIDPQPRRVDVSGEGIAVEATEVSCTATTIHLRVDWVTASPITEGLSVFVHLRDAADVVLAQDDRSAPVYGWWPVTRWTVGEVVRDVYSLLRVAGGTRIVYGMYRQLADGRFENVREYTAAVDCGDEQR